MGVPPVLNITSELILPVQLTICQGLVVATLHLIYDLHRHILIGTTPLPPIMVAQSTIFFLDFLLMSTVPQSELTGGLPHILTLTLIALLTLIV